MSIFAKSFGLGLLVWLFVPGGAVADSAPQVRLMRLPDGGVQPQALVDGGGTVHLVYLTGDPKASDVVYTRRSTGQTNFSRSWRVNSLPGSAIAVGTVRGAQLALGRNGWVHVVWNGSDRASSKPGAGAPMLYTRLNDTEDRFELQRDLMTTTTHLDGGGSVAADANGHVYVAWHGHRRTGPQEEINRAVFVSISTDDGSTFSPERPVNPPETGVCGCCGLKAFADERGALAILYRSANPAGNRDSVLLLSTNCGSSFAARVLGEWHVSTCPMSTHALVQGSKSLMGAWERDGQVYFAPIFADRSEPGPEATAVAGDTKNRKHPSIATSRTAAGPLLIAWTEGTGWEKGGALAWECLDRNGARISSGRRMGVPVWGSVGTIAEADGSFTILY
jgi:hypothetical protein